MSPSHAQDKHETLIKSEMTDMANRQAAALLADCLGGCGGATALEQLYEVAHFAQLVQEISKKLNKPQDLVKICLKEMMSQQSHFSP